MTMTTRSYYYSRGSAIFAISVLASSGGTSSNTMAFSPATSQTTTTISSNSHRMSNIIHKHREHHHHTKHPQSSSLLSMSYNNNNNNNNFDLSKPTFDLFALRSVRNDALLQYNTLNQSEPLRINLYLFLTLTLFSLPTINESIGIFADGTNSLPTIAASVLGGLGAGFLFVRECGFRTKQLTRMEKELNAEYLKVKLSTRNKLDPRLYGKSQPVLSLKECRGKRRVMAVCGPTSMLKEALVDMRVLRRRLGQSTSVLVLVSTDGEEDGDLEQMGVRESELRACQWLAQLQDKPAWLDYFSTLTNDNDLDDDKNRDGLVWFGLNYSGRSFASGKGKPRLLEIMGQHLRPVELLDETDVPEPTVGLDADTKRMVEEVLGRQAKFYTSLTGGDLEGIRDVCAGYDAKEVSAVLDSGGRVDNWQSCLAEGARPANMKTSGSDVLILSPTMAYSTTIEFPVSAGGYGSVGNELLAVQRWGRADGVDGGDWKMEFHQTIPWAADSKAGGTLRCDGRGCVALTSVKETRQSGRKIG